MNSPIDEVDKTTPDTPSETEIPAEETPAEEAEVSDEEDAPKRNAEGRIGELLARNKELEKKIDFMMERMAPPPPPPRVSETEVDPEVQKAKEYLRNNLKMVSQEDLEKRLKWIEDNQALQNEHSRLLSQYDGSDGRPRYDKSAVEDYMRKSGVYNPEVAYKALHETELFDWNLKRSESKKKQQPYVERKGMTGDREDNTITREKIAEWMKTPEGRVKYEQNREKILKLMHEGSL